MNLSRKRRCLTRERMGLERKRKKKKEISYAFKQHITLFH